MDRVRFDGADPERTIPLPWAEQLLMRWHARSPGQFGNRLAEVVSDWAASGAQDQAGYPPGQ